MPGQAKTKRIIAINDIQITVTLKPIKHLHLTVKGPRGEVAVSAPIRMGEKRIMDFIQAKLPWIEKHRERLRAMPSAPELKFVEGEIHYIWGRPHLLRLHLGANRDLVEICEDKLHIYARGNQDPARLDSLLEAWRKTQIIQAAARHVERWRQILTLPKIDIVARRMKSRWGSCQPLKGKIALNTELVKKPPICLDYVTLHELGHFFAPNHGPDFKNFMDHYYPGWQAVRKLLNSRTGA